MIFPPAHRTVGRLHSRSQDEIRNEPMVFAADALFANRHGGPITKEFLAEHLCPLNPYEWVIDSKTVMLMPGFWPCIPGWHHDDVPRSRSDGQPNYLSPEYRASHVMAIVGNCSLTEFVDEAVDVPPVPLGRTVYQAWDRYLDAFRPRTVRVAECDVVAFTWEAFHRGTPATHAGWRFFIRATRNTQRPIKNERRTQVQVYLSDPSAGW